MKTAYTRRGTIKSVDSSYGALVKNIKRSADNLVQSMALGDAAETKTAMSYDSRRRLRSLQTFRAAASLWSTAPPSISPVPVVTDVTRQLLLQDLDYSYDIVNNPIEIRDWRDPHEWPDGAKPVTRLMGYDDLYRVTRVDYEYPGGTDKSVSPFAPELAGTRQLRDFAAHASANGLRFDLWVRPTTQLSPSLALEVADGAINLRYIP